MTNQLVKALVLAARMSLVLAVTAFLFCQAPEARADPLKGPVPPPAPPPFSWNDAFPFAVPAASQPQPPLPDLSVHWIARTPRYHRYCVDYGRGLPELCEGTEQDQRFPEPGEVVTFTAQIANQGVTASPAAEADWIVGLAGRRTTVLPALAPGITATLAITWPWPAAPLTVTLALDPDGAVEETTRANNVRHHRTDALYLDVAVHPLVDAAFARRPNLVGSWGFADWMQAQVDTMNTNLAASAYAAAPDGAADRVRIDRILVTDEVGGPIVTSSLDFDGRWTFRVEPDDPDTPEDEAAQSAESYAASFARQIDWGLIHELTHQLGAIDLYQLNIAGSYQNEVLDGDGRPLLMGFQWTRPDLMGGGDRGDYPWYRYSEHSVLALNSNAGSRRGFFGEYLYDIPARVSLRLLDNSGLPLSGAHVTGYQASAGTVRHAPVFEGTADAAGRFELPARPVPFGGITTATGHTLAPNPFGAIDVVGMNSQLLLKISRNGQQVYTWWSITDLNLAHWHGQDTVERTIVTHFPASAAPAPPPYLEGMVDGRTVTLAWPASQSPAVTGYRVYRGEEPAFYPFDLVAATTQPAYSGELDRTARYAVTAVDAQGRESGYSPLFRAQRLVAPGDLAVNPTSGQRTILDRHDGSLVTQWADDRWVGRQGSVHVGLTGSEGLFRNEQGLLLVAATAEDRIKIVDPAWPLPDAAAQVVNWFGRERFMTGTLAGPASVVQAGPAFTVALKPQPDAATLGLASFDNRLDLSGAAPVHAAGVTVAPGRFDGGIRVNGVDRLEYDVAEHLDPAHGSLELWVRPEWVWDDDEEHVFVEIGGASYRLRLAKADWNGLYAWFSDETHDLVLYAPVDTWQAGDWHHLAVAWQAAQPGAEYRRYSLWVDGVLCESQVLRRPVDGAFERMSVGAGLDRAGQADAVLDELRISAVGRVGNSQHVRLIASQRQSNLLAVFDWLGNPVSALGGPGDQPGQFASPQGLDMRGDRLWLADFGNGRVQVLGFDGTTLLPMQSFSEGLLHPYDVAVGPGDALLVSDWGDHQVKLLSPNGHLLRRWSGPTDGHAGQFSQPAGLAWLPDGDALVSDLGNSRVVRIARPLAPHRIYFPLAAGPPAP